MQALLFQINEPLFYWQAFLSTSAVKGAGHLGEFTANLLNVAGEFTPLSKHVKNLAATAEDVTKFIAAQQIFLSLPQLFKDHLAFPKIVSNSAETMLYAGICKFYSSEKIVSRFPLVNGLLGDRLPSLGVLQRVRDRGALIHTSLSLVGDLATLSKRIAKSSKPILEVLSTRKLFLVHIVERIANIALLVFNGNTIGRDLSETRKFKFLALFASSLELVCFFAPFYLTAKQAAAGRQAFSSFGGDNHSH